MSSLLEFLNPLLQTEQIQSTVQMGLIGRFEFMNCSFQNYLLADMIMNDPSFAAFFMLNDSDKISKDNQSIYIYFQNLLEGDRSNTDVWRLVIGIGAIPIWSINRKFVSIHSGW